MDTIPVSNLAFRQDFEWRDLPAVRSMCCRPIDRAGRQIDRGTRCTSSLTRRQVARSPFSHDCFLGSCLTRVPSLIQILEMTSAVIAQTGKHEAIGMSGDTVLYEGKPAAHAHMVAGDPDGTTRAGHLLDAYVSPTLAVMITVDPVAMQKRFDTKTDLTLIDSALK